MVRFPDDISPTLFSFEAAEYVEKARALHESDDSPLPGPVHILKAIWDHPDVLAIVERLDRPISDWQENVAAAYRSDIRVAVSDSFRTILRAAGELVPRGEVEVVHLFAACATQMSGPFGGSLTHDGIMAVIHGDVIKKVLSDGLSDRPETSDQRSDGSSDSALEGPAARVIIDDAQHDGALALLNLIEQQIEDELENEDNPPEVRDFLRDVLLPEIRQLREILEDHAESIDAKPGLIVRAKVSVERLQAVGLAGTTLVGTTSGAIVATLEAAERIGPMIP